MSDESWWPRAQSRARRNSPAGVENRGSRFDYELSRIGKIALLMLCVSVVVLILVYSGIARQWLGEHARESARLQNEVTAASRAEFDLVSPVVGGELPASSVTITDYEAASAVTNAAATQLLQLSSLDPSARVALLEQERIRLKWERLVAAPLIAGTVAAESLASVDELTLTQWQLADGHTQAIIADLRRVAEERSLAALTVGSMTAIVVLSVSILAIVATLRKRLRVTVDQMAAGSARLVKLLESLGQMPPLKGDAVEDLLTMMLSLETMREKMQGAETRERVRQDLAMLLTDQLNEAAAARTTARELANADAVGADYVVVWVLDTSRRPQILAEHTRPGLDQFEAPDPPDFSALQAAGLERNRSAISDADLQSDQLHMSPGGDVRTWLVISMWDGWDVIGCIFFGRRAEATFSRVQRDIAWDASRDLAATLLRARRVTLQQQLVGQLQQSSTDRDLFVSTVSHELRTPLTSISGYTEMLVDGDFGALERPQLEAMETIERNAKAMNELVGDLLTISRIEGRGRPDNAQLITLADMAGQVVTSFVPAAKQAGLSLTIKGKHSPAAVLADATDIREVLENLISNSIRYTLRNGTVVVSVFEEAPDLAVLRVADTGIGVPEDELPKLMEPFFRASNARAMPVKGTGLGLATVNAIADRYDGKLDIDSKVGAGTSFTLRFPAATEDEPVTSADVGN